jgi:zinc protease
VRPFQLFHEVFYGSHPYALPDAGYEHTVSALTESDIRSWYEANVVADAAVIFAVGDVEIEEFRETMEASFGRMRKSSALRPPLPPFVPPPVQLEIAEVRDRRQSAIVIGFSAVPPAHPDWTVLRVIQDVVSGLGGTFFAELRGKRSLAYTVFAGEASRQEAAAFVGYIATEARKEGEAREALLEAMRRLATDGIGEEDLRRAKSYLAGTTKIRLQTNAAIASELSRNYLWDLGTDFTQKFLDRIRGITLDEVRSVANRYLTRDNYVVATMRGKA